jgi:hypothetical protein
MKLKISAIAIAILIAFSFYGETSFRFDNATTAQTPIANPTFVWFFGYIGGYFYPQTQLDLNQSYMISVAQTLSQQVKNLSLVTAVSETQVVGPGAINWTNGGQIRKIRSYVNSLNEYASVVYGRIDLENFNATTACNQCSIYSEVKNYTNKLNITGIWLDHPAIYYTSVGNLTFNHMMQNLSGSFPKLHFILNHTEFKKVGPGNSNGYITPLVNDTWQKMTYVAPSFSCNSTSQTCSLDSSKFVKALDALYPNHVLLHFDAYGKVKGEPMSRFSSFNTTNEINDLQKLAFAGTHPSKGAPTYLTLYPVMGAWTFQGSPYMGTLYNSLSVGLYARSTIANFTQIMIANNVTVPYV